MARSIFNFQVDTSKLKALKGKLERFKTVDMKPALRQLLLAAADETRMNFRTQGASAGSKWVALAESTIKQRLRQGFGAGPILDRRGDLKRAATDELGGQIVERKFVRFFIRDRKLRDIANYHQRGGRNLPQRRIFVLTRRLILRFSKILSGETAGQLKRNLKKP